MEVVSEFLRLTGNENNRIKTNLIQSQKRKSSYSATTKSWQDVKLNITHHYQLFIVSRSFTHLIHFTPKKPKNLSPNFLT